MLKKKELINYKDMADYNIKWETIYANSDISDEELNEFKSQLEKEGYRILNIVKGNN